MQNCSNLSYYILISVNGNNNSFYKENNFLDINTIIIPPNCLGISAGILINLDLLPF